MNTLTVDEGFEGFTFEQATTIALSARHFSRGSHKGGKRMPTCTIGGETFRITSVRSIGLVHSVRRCGDGKWVTLNGSALIQWQTKGTPPGTPVEATVKDLSPDEIRKRVADAVGRLTQARALAEQAAKDLWGIKAVESHRESALRCFYQLAPLVTRLRGAEDELAEEKHS